MRNFDGSMDEESIPATIYSYWQYFFYQSLFKKYTSKGKLESKLTDKTDDGKVEQFWTLKRRLLLVDNYAFYDYYQRMIYSLSAGENHQRF
jgi:hypothetical protein